MIAHVEALSRRAFVDRYPAGDVGIAWCITIRSADESETAQPAARTLRLVFDDLDPRRLPAHHPLRARARFMDMAHAEAIVRFVAEAQRSPHAEALVVHCRFGRSRSVAVAAYAEFVAGLPQRPGGSGWVGLLLAAAHASEPRARVA